MAGLEARHRARRSLALAIAISLADCALPPPAVTTVQLRDTGAIEVDGTRVADANLSAAVASKRGDNPVVVRVADATHWSDVVHVLDTLAQAEVPSVQLAALGSTDRVTAPLVMPHVHPIAPVHVVLVDLDAPASTISVDGHAAGTADELRAQLATSVAPGVTFIVRADASVPFVRVLDAVLQVQRVGGAVLFGVVPSSPAASPARRAKPAITEWKCAFPKEADAPPEVDHAAVVVRVDVDSSGRATSVEVFDDPGRGFGDAARACALGTMYEPARDDNGKAVAGTTPKIRIRFER